MPRGFHTQCNVTKSNYTFMPHAVKKTKKTELHIKTEDQILPAMS